MKSTRFGVKCCHEQKPEEFHPHENEPDIYSACNSDLTSKSEALVSHYLEKISDIVW
jgi:hypothetical protein